MDYLIEEFIERYLSRAEIIHRLPVSRPISSFWPALQEARRARATEFTLKDSHHGILQAIHIYLDIDLERLIGLCLIPIGVEFVAQH